MNVWVSPGIGAVLLLNTDCSNRASVVLPLDEGPDIPTTIALSVIILFFCLVCIILLG